MLKNANGTGGLSQNRRDVINVEPGQDAEKDDLGLSGGEAAQVPKRDVDLTPRQRLPFKI